MRTPIDHARAVGRHPEESDAAMEQLNARLRRKRIGPIAAAAASWSYSYSIAIAPVAIDPETGMPPFDVMPGARESKPTPEDPRIGLNLRAEYDGSEGLARFGGVGEFLTGDDIPQEVRAALTPELVEEDSLPHVARTTVLTPAGRETILIDAGYRSREGIFLNAHRVGAPMPPEGRSGGLYEITPAGPQFAGGLVETAWQRLKETEEGATFRYRNRPLRRLTAEEIREILPDNDPGLEP